jgi:uncharacterized membrane protein YgcG
VPGIVSTAHLQTRAIRARRATARIDPRFVVLVVAMLVVFAACFAIGRATVASGPPVEELSSLQAASRSAASQIHLSSAPPIEIPEVVSVVRRSSRPASVETAASPSRGSVRVLSSAPLRQPQATVSPAPASASPAPAPSPSAPSTSGSSRGKAGHSAPAGSGGGSFDSSG